LLVGTSGSGALRQKVRFLYLLYNHESSKLFADPHSFTANFMAPLAALAVAGTLAWLRNCTPLSGDFQLRLGLSVSVLEPACAVGKHPRSPEAAVFQMDI
jgi:hypothetical protein